METIWNVLYNVRSILIKVIRNPKFHTHEQRRIHWGLKGIIAADNSI